MKTIHYKLYKAIDIFGDVFMVGSLSILKYKCSDCLEFVSFIEL